MTIISLSRDLLLFTRRIRNKREKLIVFKGRPLLQGVPLSKTVHRTVFEIHPCGALCNCGVTPHSVGRCRTATKGTGLLSLPHTPPEGAASDLTGTSPLSFGHLPILWGVTLPKEHSPFGIPFFGKAAFYTYYNEKSSVSLQNRAFFGNWREKSFFYKVRSLVYFCP